MPFPTFHSWPHLQFTILTSLLFVTFLRSFVTFDRVFTLFVGKKFRFVLIPRCSSPRLIVSHVRFRSFIHSPITDMVLVSGLDQLLQAILHSIWFLIVVPSLSFWSFILFVHLLLLFDFIHQFLGDLIYVARFVCWNFRYKLGKYSTQ